MPKIGPDGQKVTKRSNTRGRSYDTTVFDARDIENNLSVLHNGFKLIPFDSPIDVSKKDSDQIIHKVIMPAYIDYFNLYLDLVNESTKISTSRSKILLDGQKSYLSYRAEKDPARNMLTRFYGRKWTEAYINEVLFSL